MMRFTKSWPGLPATSRLISTVAVRNRQPLAPPRACSWKGCAWSMRLGATPRKMSSTPEDRTSITAAVLTVSDSASAGTNKDLSGPAVVTQLQKQNIKVVATEVVADEQPKIEAALVRLSERAQLVVTTGGTGLAARDVTPEATRAVCDRVVEGIGERMRAEGSKK